LRLQNNEADINQQTRTLKAYSTYRIASPFVFIAKSILQSLCKRELGWDEEIPQKQLSTWNKWLDQLKELEMIKVDRCYKPSTFESVDLCQLHCFANASDISYGCVFYLRLIDKEGADLNYSIAVDEWI
jgi:hypothetical protein